MLLLLKVKKFLSLSEDNLESRYQDIIKCLKYASDSESIDESRAIRDELLSLFPQFMPIMRKGKKI